MNIYVSFLNIIHIDFLTLKFIILPILCYIFALSIVTNNALNLGIMTNLQTLNDCTCLVQYVHLSCPLPTFTCKDCMFNPLSWSHMTTKTFISNSLNMSRRFPFYIVRE